MKKDIKFTFKTTKPTGRYKSFHSPSHAIKLKGKECGSIAPEKPFQIGFMVMKKDIMEDGNPNCSWKWIRLKKESSSLQEAKDFINENADLILSKYNIHYLE